jgi:hypothetical protein
MPLKRNNPPRYSRRPQSADLTMQNMFLSNDNIDWGMQEASRMGISFSWFIDQALTAARTSSITIPNPIDLGGENPKYADKTQKNKAKGAV